MPRIGHIENIPNEMGMMDLVNQCTYCRKVFMVRVSHVDFTRWTQGEKVQNVWPEKSANEREEIMTGNHGECFDKFMEEVDELYDEDEG